MVINRVSHTKLPLVGYRATLVVLVVCVGSSENRDLNNRD
jgi:hypothetical protein